MGHQYYISLSSVDLMVLVGAFLTSGIYWIILDIWHRFDPDSYDENTWLMVVIGDGYILIWSMLIVPIEVWIKLALVFLSAGFLIITRSLIINIQRNRRLRKNYEVNGGGNDEDSQEMAEIS